MRAIIFISSVENPEEPIDISQNAFTPVLDNEIVNDFDLIAVEAAIQLKESGDLDEVIVFGMGTALSHLQKCLAMGADRAVAAPCDRSQITPETIVETAITAFNDNPMSETLWMFGKLGVNFESHQTAQRLAVRLGVPCLGSVHTLQRHGKTWHITCESDNGIPCFHVSAPFVMTADLRLATPRFPSLPNIVRSRKKPVSEIQPVMAPPGLTLKTTHIEPAQENRRTCQILNGSTGCQTLLTLLRP